MNREQTESWAEDTARDLLRIDAELAEEDLEALPQTVWDGLVSALGALDDWIMARRRGADR